MDVVPLRRGDEADVDAVDEDVVLRDLDRERLRERVARGAVDRRREERGVGVARVDGADVDDAAAARGAHVREHLAGAADQREELDVEVGDPVLVGERLEGAGVRAAGVVDEEVDPAERLGGARDEVPDLLGIGDVGRLRVGERPAPRPRPGPRPRSGSRSRPGRPRSTSSRAIAAPSPFDPPVTSARRPSRPRFTCGGGRRPSRRASPAAAGRRCRRRACPPAPRPCAGGSREGGAPRRRRRRSTSDSSSPSVNRSTPSRM